MIVSHRFKTEDQKHLRVCVEELRSFYEAHIPHAQRLHMQFILTVDVMAQDPCAHHQVHSSGTAERKTNFRSIRWYRAVGFGWTMSCR